MKFVLVTDPLCPWCYAFGHVLLGAANRYPNLPVFIVVGGLRTEKRALMGIEQKRYEVAKWDRVRKLSGLPLNHEAFLESKFYSNTEFMCRAVVVIRELARSTDQLSILYKLQEAYYVIGKDISNGRKIAKIVTDIMKEVGLIISPEDFYRRWREPETVAKTRDDFERVKSWNISHFPILMLESNYQLNIVASGYITTNDLHTNLLLTLKEFEHKGVSSKLKVKPV